ncbi:hypothetical protein ScPMuIL_000939 [Solemya velum]
MDRNQQLNFQNLQKVFKKDYNKSNSDPISTGKDNLAVDSADQQEQSYRRNGRRRTALSVWYDYNDTTTFHGYRYVFGKEIGIGRRFIWLLILMLFMALMLVQVSERIQYYYTWPVTVDFRVKYDNILEFPAVTICNQNTYRKTTAFHMNHTATIEGMFTTGENVIGNLSLKELDYMHRHTIENMIVRCKWAASNCSSEDFVMRHTDHGICYTFNGNSTDQDKLYVTKAGTGSALEMVINSETYEYMIGWNSGAGIKILIHDPDVFPLVEVSGQSVSTDTHTTVGIKKTMISNLGPPHGTCEHATLRYFKGNYNVATCQLECQVDQVIRRCNCTMPYVPRSEITANLSACTVDQYFGCVKYVHEENQKNVCTCPNPCEEINFTPTFTYASLSDFAIKQTQAYMDMDSVLSRVIEANDVDSYRSGLAREDSSKGNLSQRFTAATGRVVSEWNRTITLVVETSETLADQCNAISSRRHQKERDVKELDNHVSRLSQMITSLLVNDFLDFAYQWENSMDVLSVCDGTNLDSTCETSFRTMTLLLSRRSFVIQHVYDSFTELSDQYKVIDAKEKINVSLIQEELKKAANDLENLINITELVYRGNMTYNRHVHNLQKFSERSEVLFFTHYVMFQKQLFLSLQKMNDIENHKSALCQDIEKYVIEIQQRVKTYFDRLNNTRAEFVIRLDLLGKITKNFFSDATKMNTIKTTSQYMLDTILMGLSSSIQVFIRDLTASDGIQSTWEKLSHSYKSLEGLISDNSSFYETILRIKTATEILTDSHINNNMIISQGPVIQTMLTGVIDRLREILEDGSVDYNFYRKNFIHLSISFHELNHIHLQQQEAYDMFALMSEYIARQ